MCRFDTTLCPFKKQTLKFKEMFHRFHLLMKYPDHKNVGFTAPVKNSVPLMIVTANTLCYFLAFMSHEWRAR